MLRSNFKYNGRSLADFGMKMYDPDADPQGVERTIDKAAQNSAREVPNHYATYRNGVLQHNMLIIKDPDLHESSNDLRLTEKEVHRIKSWLFSTTLPTELILPQDDEEIDVRYFGVFTNVQYFMPVRKTCFGLQLTFTCNAPYGFSPVTSKRFYLNSTEVLGDYLNSAVEFAKMIPPTIVVGLQGDGTFSGETLTITNKHDGNRSMTLTLPEGMDRITVNCDNKMALGRTTTGGVSTEHPLTLHELGIAAFDSENTEEQSFQVVRLIDTLYWLQLQHGSNALTFTVDDYANPLYVEIQTRYIIEAGGF